MMTSNFTLLFLYCLNRKFRYKRGLAWAFSPSVVNQEHKQLTNNHRRPKLTLWIYYEVKTCCEYITKLKHVVNILWNRKNIRAYLGTQQLQFTCQEFETKTIHLVHILFLLLLQCFLGWFWSELVAFEVSMFTIYVCIYLPSRQHTYWQWPSFVAQ